MRLYQSFKRLFIIIAPYLMHVIGGKEGGCEGEVWRNFRREGRKFSKRENGASQSATYCIMCKRGVEWRLGTRDPIVAI